MGNHKKQSADKYAKLDSAILNKIGGNPSPFSQIFVRDVQSECIRIAQEENKSEPYRILDRRLQTLRKRGVICNVTGKGWVKP